MPPIGLKKAQDMQHKTLHLQAHDGAKDVGDDDLAAINRIAVDGLSADQVIVRQFYLAHNAIDRDAEVFDAALLRDFARTLPGKGFFIKHPMGWDGDSGPGVGRWYKAEVIETTQEDARALLKEPGLRWPTEGEPALLLDAAMFLLADEEGKALNAKIGAGVVSDVSIGFRASSRTDITDGQNTVIARRLHAPGEALEGSAVWLGAQPGARAHKHMNRTTEAGEPEMDYEKLYNDMKAKHDAQTDELKAVKGKAAQFEKLEALLGDKAPANADDIVALVRDFEAGKTYRNQLLDDVVSFERQKGLVGDDEEAANACKGMYANLPTDRLKARRDALHKSLGEPQLGGSNPNRADSRGDDNGQKDPKNPLHNPAITGKAA